MGFNILNEKNEVVGWTADEFVLPSGQRFVPDDANIAQADLDDLRLAKSATIADQVRRLLSNSAWRVERAAERDMLGLDGESPQDVYAYREAVRRAGDRAEREIAELDNADAINSYRLKILPSDYPVIGHLTQLQFLRRFTPEERTNIAQLRTQNPQINDYLSLLELAKFVNPYDPDVILGVNMLEQIGVLGQGRAGQILNGDSA